VPDALLRRLRRHPPGVGEFPDDRGQLAAVLVDPGPAVHLGDLRTPASWPPRPGRGRPHHDVRMGVYDHDAQLVTEGLVTEGLVTEGLVTEGLVTEGTGTAAPGGAAITAAGSWPRSCSSTIAALRPGAPVMEPPG
jgi:hypothetical protein